MILSAIIYFLAAISTILFYDLEDYQLIELARHIVLPATFFTLGIYFNRYLKYILLITAILCAIWGLATVILGTSGMELSSWEISGLTGRDFARGYINPITHRFVGATGICDIVFPCIVVMLFAPLFNSRRTKIIIYLCALSAGYVAYCAETRTTFMLIALAVLFRFCIFGTSRQKLSFAAVAICAVLYLWSTDNSLNWLPDRLQPVYTQEAGLTGRVDIWHNRLHLLEDNYLGKGAAWIGEEGASSHNQLLDITICFGLAGAVSYVMLFMLAAKNNIHNKSYIGGLVLIICCLSVESPMFSSRMLDCYIWFFLASNYNTK